MRKSSGRNCNSAIYIICEGSKSEPWFIRRFMEWASERFPTDYYADVFPTPRSKEEIESSGNLATRRKSSGRKLNSDASDKHEPEKPKDGNPLLWVEHGREKLDSYSEVYVVFDKDGHPLMKEAFNLADQPINDGRKVNIILNSRSFEYYMLLHFSKIYKAFEKTECGEKIGGHTRSFRCCLPNAVAGKGCGGDICINGYARRHHYWYDSKDEHTFVSASNIWRGMKNGELIRNRALLENPNIPIYLMNPYVDFQLLLSRLLDKRILRCGNTIFKDCGRQEHQSITRKDNNLIITNGSSVLTMKLDEGWISFWEYPQDIVQFEIFKSNYKNIREAEIAFTQIQEQRNILLNGEAIKVNAKDSINVPIDKIACDNIFAILKFDSKEYLVF